MTLQAARDKLGDDRTPAHIGDIAAADLRYIRETIDAAQVFTLVPGRGCVVMGIIAIVAAALDMQPAMSAHWLTIWLTAAVAAIAVALYEMAEKAKRQGIRLRRNVAFRFLMTLAPACAAGAILTVALLGDVGRDVIAAIWLLGYGAGLAACGVLSIPVVTIAGITFFGLGTVALTAPAGWAPALLAMGFGGVHIVLGSIVWRKHGA